MDAATKQEMLYILDNLPDYKLEALHPLLLLVSSDDYDDTVLTPEESAEMKQCLEDYEKDPKSFISLAELKAQCASER
jgi:hypothetical protein